MTLLRAFGVLAAIAVLGLASPSQAAPVTYAVATIASGTLGGTPFTSALITVSLVGDTSAVFQPLPADLPALFANQGTATVTIAGLGTATFNDPGGYAAVAFPAIPGEIPLPSVGIWEGFDIAAESGTGILGIGSNSLAGYNLKSQLGPLTGAAAGGATEPDGSFYEYATNRGALVISSTGDTGTVTVTITPVPEPTSLSLLGLGLCSVSLLARHRRRKEHS